jgi:RNA polymerase sigma-70 factor (ECF subfamily)
LETTIVFNHKELVEKSKLGDRIAQYKLYEQYVDAMFNIGIRMLKSKEDAEDIVQESFIKAFKNLNSFNYESTFGAWLKRIVVNNCINFLKLKKMAVTEIETHEFYLTEEKLPEVNELDIKKVKKGIDLLPNGYQQIINLYLIEGYDHNEISEILGLTVSTSKSQYHRAKKKLIEIINTL